MKDMKGRHIGIFALAFLPLLLTVPSAFAQETGIPNAAGHANAAFNLMDLITNGQTEAATLTQMIANNGLNLSLDEYAEALDEAAGLVAAGEYEDAEAVLADADEIIDDVYTQLYAQVDSRQNERFTDFVEDAKSSIEFILNNVDISDPVRIELQATLDIFEGGDHGAILAATSESSDAGLTASMIPGFDKASDNGQGKGIGLGQVPPGIQKLPDKIKAQFGYSTDSNPSTVSYEGTDGAIGNGVLESDLPPGIIKELILDSEDGLSDEELVSVLESDLPPGIIKEILLNSEDGLSADLVSALESSDLPPGIIKELIHSLENDYYLDYGFSVDDVISDDISDNAGLTDAELDAIAEAYEAAYEAAQEAAEAEEEAAEEAAEEAEEEAEEEGGGGGPPCPPKC